MNQIITKATLSGIMKAKAVRFRCCYPSQEGTKPSYCKPGRLNIAYLMVPALFAQRKKPMDMHRITEQAVSRYEHLIAFLGVFFPFKLLSGPYIVLSLKKKEEEKQPKSSLDFIKSDE
ncbi:hypothetical protein NC652_010872 [Populus alba x Populus x berolinensis]|nr:hypothetical protein NC652_010872 [Populus alba x Populus x berolinensis]